MSLSPYQYGGERALAARSAMAVSKELARRTTPMSKANADPTAEALTWHAMGVDEVERRLTADIEKGLDAGEASSRLQKYGPNRLPEGKKRGPLMRFLSQFNNILVYVLLGAGFIKLMLNLWVDASIIFGVVILNALLGFIQEGKAEKALESIRNMLSAEARTLRGGETRMIAAEELVPGDVVLLESGDKIPADLRLVDAKNLRTEEAALTGESVPADKNTEAVPANATVGDRECMAFSGTMVVSGRATGVVVATGSETELGRINQLLAGVSALETPLLRQIKKFGYAITAVIAVVGALVFAYGKWVKGMDFVELFQAVVGIAVSVIPEGLPAIITITLAIGVQRMAQRNAIIRRLPAVETLGSVSRICSDKTGTLTLMEMMAVSAVTAESTYKITGNGYAPEGEIKREGKPAGKQPVLELMGRASLLCNDAELFEQDGAWKVEGDPTEGALYPFATKLGMERQSELARLPRIDAIPFESEHKFMATLHSSTDGKELLFVKGAPEVILEHCDRQQTGGGERKPIDRAHFMNASDRLAEEGARLARESRPQGRQPHSRRPAEKSGPSRPDRPARPAAQGGDRGSQGMSWRRHPCDNDYRRSQDHSRGHRQDARHRRRKDGALRRRDRGNERGSAAGEGADNRCIRARQPRAQAAPGEGDPGQQANRSDDRRWGERCPGVEEGRHWRGDGDQGHRGHQGSGRDDPSRR
jgi:magnesium-transporting ATPase (P-type)